MGNFLTINSRNDSRQSQFLNGKVPVLSGPHNGTAAMQGSWLGKEFFNDNTGINNFKNGDLIEKQIPFKTYTGKSISDPQIDVLKIDYNIPENPFYLRFILDELVEIEEGMYLGKLHFTLLPFVPFTITYFALEEIK